MLSGMRNNATSAGPRAVGSAPAAGAVFRALAENPGRTKSSQRLETESRATAGGAAQPATPGAGVPPNTSYPAQSNRIKPPLCWRPSAAGRGLPALPEQWRERVNLPNEPKFFGASHRWILLWKNDLHQFMPPNQFGFVWLRLGVVRRMGKLQIASRVFNLRHFTRSSKIDNDHQFTHPICAAAMTTPHPPTHAAGTAAGLLSRPRGGVRPVVAAAGPLRPRPRAQCPVVRGRRSRFGGAGGVPSGGPGAGTCLRHGHLDRTVAALG